MTTPPNAASPDIPRFQFGLKHILYAMACVGVSLGLRGAGGLVVVACIFLFWRTVFDCLRR